ncbi:MAG TPA: glycosyltransferase [Candidatus Limnocylindrales bacterium]|nr:glycosyltransferase [Candidatus Limnocylindrales bacterium]
MTRRLVLLLNNPFLTDSRSWKIARSASAAGWSVTVVARGGPDLPVTEERDGFRVLRVPQPAAPRWLPAPPLPDPTAAGLRGPAGYVRDSLGRGLQALRYLALTRRWARDIERAAPDGDLWQAEGLVTLPVALALARVRGGRVVYDSRDVHVESGRFARLPPPWKELLRRRERAWVARADAWITVSEPYARVLERFLGRPPAAIVMNCPPAWQRPEPPEPLFHRALGLAPDTRVVLYLGQVVAHRGLEELFAAIGLVERAVLAVVGVGGGLEHYRALAASLPHAERIHFLPGVAPEAIPAWTAAADVSAMPVRGSTLNHRLNTPTKLFDAMGAGTPVVASDLPGMAAIVRQTGCGVLCDPSDPQDIARAIRDIVDASPERRAAYREACLRAARERYGWERQAGTLLALYGRLVPPG